MSFTLYNFRFLLATALCALLLSCGGDEASDESGGADSAKAEEEAAMIAAALQQSPDDPRAGARIGNFAGWTLYNAQWLQKKTAFGSFCFF